MPERFTLGKNENMKKNHMKIRLEKITLEKKMPQEIKKGPLQINAKQIHKKNSKSLEIHRQNKTFIKKCHKNWKIAIISQMPFKILISKNEHMEECSMSSSILSIIPFVTKESSFQKKFLSFPSLSSKNWFLRKSVVVRICQT